MTDVKTEDVAVKSAEEDNETDESAYSDPNGEFHKNFLEIKF